MQLDTLEYSLMSLILDCSLSTLALGLASIGGSHLLLQPEFSYPIVIYLISTGCWIFSSISLSVYDPQKINKWADEVRGVIYSLMLSFMFFTGILFFLTDISRLTILIYLIFQGTFLLGWRLIARLYLRDDSKHHVDSHHRTAIVGIGEVADSIAKILKHYKWAGLDFVGHITPEEINESNLLTLGHINDFEQIIVDNNINDLIIALRPAYHDTLQLILATLEPLPVQIRIVSNSIQLSHYKASVENFGGLPLIDIRRSALSSRQQLIKRIFDIVVTINLLILTLPIMVVIYLSIKLTSEGPALFKQERIGENGRRFVMYKFRSMVINADKWHITENYNKDLKEINHKSRNDPRITKVGQIIRRTSLDELPQLFNVLKGNMSLVGPRPEMPWLAEKYEPWQYERFTVPPGITGQWQVTGRSTRPMHLSTDDDIYYINNYSLILDIKILWKTLAVVIKGIGAY